MRPISKQKKQDVKHLLQQRKTYRKIRELTGVSLGAIKAIREELKVDIEPNGAGRKRIMTSNDVRAVIRKIVSGEYKSVEDASKQLRAAYPNKVTPSPETFRQASCVALTRSRRNARYRFAQAYRSWTVDDWKRVVFSDETKVNRLGSDGLHWTWIDPDGKLRERNVIHTYKHGDGSIMIWGCFSWHGPGFITEFQGTINSELYCSILDDEFKQSLEYYGLEINDVVFQQDNEPKHMSRKATQWFADNGVEVGREASPSSLKDDWQAEFGEASDDLDDAHYKIEKSGEAMKKKYRVGKKVTYIEGDLVLLHGTGNGGGTKLEPPWTGLYSIDKHMGNDTNMLRDRHLLLPGLYHASRLKAYRPRPGRESL